MKIIKAEDLPEGEEVFLRKSFDGWRVIYPMAKDITQPANFLEPSTWKNINWFNVCTGGNYWNMIKPFIYLLLLYGIVCLYNHDVDSCRHVINNLDEFCLPYNTINNQNQMIQNMGFIPPKLPNISYNVNNIS